jgi:GrpB-like predicted nucleotidyltransferase (UPF0157 family)
VRVDVVPYDPTWPAAFESIRVELTKGLGRVPVVAIEHVGSTSVPGLAAKPVIDVDVVVSGDNLQEAVEALEAIGYRRLGDLGVPDRHAMAPPAHGPRRNVYVTVAGSLALRNHLGVREVLRADPELRDLYGDLKRAVAEREFDGIGDYVAAKSGVLQVILERAGIGTEERSAIEEVNRAG